MKAILYRRYGPPDVLECAEVETPKPGDDEVLVRIRAASVNPLDWHFMRGSPTPLRIATGLFRPKDPRIGVDLAGVVESVGAKVTRFQRGDEVFGAARGSLAEFVSAREERLAPKPPNVTFDEAASVPVAGITALQALRDKGRVREGQKVLVVGAAGGVGTFAVQIAKAFGAEVAGVCSTGNVEMVRSIGADHVVDYTKDDFSREGERYDVICDCVGDRKLSDYRRAMTPRGIHVGVGGSDEVFGMLAGFAGTLIVSPFITQRFVSILARIRGDDLDALRELLESGTVKPVVDRRYPLEEASEAIRYLETGHARGKVVVAVADS